jgi:hypothetical protein
MGCLKFFYYNLLGKQADIVKSLIGIYNGRIGTVFKMVWEWEALYYPSKFRFHIKEFPLYVEFFTA